MSRFLASGLAALLVLLPATGDAAAQDPVRVTAVLTADRVAVGTPTTLRITVETRGTVPDEIREPQLSRELDIVGTSEFSQTQVSVPGGRSRATRRDIIIVARRPGVYRIPPVVVRVGGRAYETDALDLRVTDGGATGGFGGAAPTPAESVLQLRLLPDTVYVGQQVLLQAEATFGEDSRSRQSRPASFDPPTPTGFWIQDMPDPVSVSLGVRDGRTVETQTYRRALFALAPGPVTVPPAVLYYEVRRGLLSAPETREIRSDSARLVVLPLPDAGRPANFAGAVGRLRIRASITPERVAAGEAALLTVEIEGRGNVRTLPEPRLPAMDADVFPPTQEASVTVVGQEVGGVKRFRWVVVPHAEGTLTIPPLEYSTFDPELRQYVTLQTDTLRLHAHAAVGAAAAAAPGGAGAAAVPRPARAQPGREAAGWARTPAFAVLQAVPLALLAFAGVVRRRRAAPPSRRQHMRRIRGELALLARRSDEGRLADLERLLAHAVTCLTDAPPGDSVAVLRALGRDRDAKHLADILADAQRVRYAPGHDADAADVLVRRAAGFVDSIGPKRRRFPWLAALLLPAVLAGALPQVVAAETPQVAAAQAPQVAAAQAPQDPRFGEAAALLEAGDAAAAANRFLAYARDSPRDPHGWYNVGVAAYDAGDRGRAVWAWLRALRLAPRDADIQHNLRVAGGGDAVARLRPADRLAAGERIVVAAVAWWLLMAAVAARRRRRFALATGALAVALLVAVGGAALRDAMRPTLVTPLQGGAALYAGPSTGDQQIGELPVGAVAEVRERRDAWLLVRHEDAEAWVERPAVAAP
jgi:hypothetical protein